VPEQRARKGRLKAHKKDRAFQPGPDADATLR
jgi:hypothetical protein